MSTNGASTSCRFCGMKSAALGFSLKKLSRSCASDMPVGKHSVRVYST